MKTLCRSTLICKRSFAIASNSSCKLIADQRRELFRNLHDEESENSLDESDSDFSSNESGSRVIVHKVEGESRSSDSDFDDRGALPRPSRSSLYCFHIYRENSANNKPFLKVHLISFDSM